MISFSEEVVNICPFFVVIVMFFVMSFSITPQMVSNHMNDKEAPKSDKSCTYTETRLSYKAATDMGSKTTLTP